MKIAIDSAASFDHFDSLFSFVAQILSKKQAFENGRSTLAWLIHLDRIVLSLMSVTTAVYSEIYKSVAILMTQQGTINLCISKGQKIERLQH